MVFNDSRSPCTQLLILITIIFLEFNIFNKYVKKIKQRYITIYINGYTFEIFHILIIYKS